MADDTASLIGSWTHSHEEDADGLLVYRPASHPFPPSRGRDGFTLAPDGTLNNVGIAAADGSDETPGRWRLDNDILRLETNDPHQGRALKIVAKSADKLVLSQDT